MSSPQGERRDGGGWKKLREEIKLSFVDFRGYSIFPLDSEGIYEAGFIFVIYVRCKQIAGLL